MNKIKKIIDKKIKNIILNKNETAQGKIFLKSFPSQIHILLTTHCNLKCVMCDVYSDNYKLSDKQFKDLIELMPYLQLLIIQGGEVFFDKRINKLLDEAQKNMVQVNLFTNGLILTEPVINKLIDAGVNLVFSIDSPFKGKYESIRKGAKFENLIHNINLFNKIKKKKKSKIEISINMVVMKRNYKDIAFMIKFAQKYKFKTLLLSAIEGNLPDKNENFFNGKKDLAILRELSEKMDRLKKQAKERGVSLFNHLPLKNDIKNDNIFNDNADCNLKGKFVYCPLPFVRISITNKECSPDCRCLKRMLIKNIPNDNKNSILNMWNSKIMLRYRKAVLKNKKNKICPEFCFKQE